MIFVCIAIVLPLVIAIGLPYAVRRYGATTERRYRWLLYVACLLFLISWFLPSPLIYGEDTSFTTHFVGGGMFSAFLWAYLQRSFGWRLSWFLEMLAVYGLVSALGCVNELAELVMVEVGLSNLPLTDTSWDILANTLGAALVWGVMRVYAYFEHSS